MKSDTHFFQFRNGKLSPPLGQGDVVTIDLCYVAWDRSLGGWVYYER